MTEILNYHFNMKDAKRIILWSYLAGVIICESFSLWSAYDGGGFERSHTLGQLTLIGIIHVTTALLWPVIAALIALQYFGIVPQPIELKIPWLATVPFVPSGMARFCAGI